MMMPRLIERLKDLAAGEDGYALATALFDLRKRLLGAEVGTDVLDEDLALALGDDVPVPGGYYGWEKVQPGYYIRPLDGEGRRTESWIAPGRTRKYEAAFAMIPAGYDYAISGTIGGTYVITHLTSPTGARHTGVSKSLELSIVLAALDAILAADGLFVRCIDLLAQSPTTAATEA